MGAENKQIKRLFLENLMRPILIILIGTISGIVWGLYFQNITPVYLLIMFMFIVIFYNITKIYKKSFKKKIYENSTIAILIYIIKYVKLIFNSKYIIIFLISIIISNIYFNIRNNIYEKTYSSLKKVSDVIGKVISNRGRKRIHLAI